MSLTKILSTARLVLMCEESCVHSGRAVVAGTLRYTVVQIVSM